MKNIFDSKDVSDLPEDILCELKKTRLGEMPTSILKLYDIKGELSVDEVLIGLFRKYAIIKTRKQVVSYIYFLTRRKYIIRIRGKQGVYRKI